MSDVEITEGAGVSFSVTGVEATGGTNSVLVWTEVVPSQTPSYSAVAPSQTPSYSTVAPSQTPTWTNIEA